MSFFWRVRIILCCAIGLLWVGVSTVAQVRSESTAAKRARTERNMELSLASAQKNPLQLRTWLYRMPKGSDLHVHITGAIYAESFIQQGAEDGLCVDSASLSFVRPKHGNKEPSEAKCERGQVPVTQAFRDQHLYDALVDAFSMRGYVPSPGWTGHDHFFNTFARFFDVDPRHLGEWVDEIASRAAAQNEQYLELMHTPDFRHAATLAAEIGWQDDFAKFRDALLARGLRDDVAGFRTSIDQAEATRRQREKCGQQDEGRACKLETRYLYQVLRGLPRESVFAQTLQGFETASADPRFVGINFVMPEDGYTSMTDYGLHMRMLDFFHGLYPKIHISLHAGEIAPDLVPYEELCCHIRMAVEQGHAERIGHGAAVMYEEHPHELMKEMAAKHVMVEINLTSNDVILGIRGQEHPLPLYRQFGVPVSLSTDDEGVSRIDLTHEYVRAVQTYGLRYADLKQMVRTGMEHIFLPGESLWRDPGTFRQMSSVCAMENFGEATVSPSCAAFLESSEKARQQFELERRFHVFEAGPW